MSHARINSTNPMPTLLKWHRPKSSIIRHAASDGGLVSNLMRFIGVEFRLGFFGVFFTHPAIITEMVWGFSKIKTFTGIV